MTARQPAHASASPASIGRSARRQARPLAAAAALSGPIRRRFARAGLALGLLVAALSGCTPPELLTIRGALDSMRVKVDTMAVHDSLAFRMILEARKEVLEQRDILLSTRATTGSTTQQLYEQMGRLEAQLNEAIILMNRASARGTPPAQSTPPPGTGTPPSTSGTDIDPNDLYDQATQDLTQGRYALALQGFDEFVRRFGSHELADNAQYGIGECLFAQSKFDSAATAYQRVGENHPKGDKVPASLYKLALSQEKLGRASEAKQTFEDLVKRYPLSGEAQLASERLGKTQRR